MGRKWVLPLLTFVSLSLNFGAAKREASPQKSYWKATLEVLTLNFTAKDELAPQVSKTTKTKLIYRVYQNPAGIIRQELITSPPLSGVVGSGRDVQIIDYRQGTLLAFDKGKPKAVRYKLTEPEEEPTLGESVSLGRMKIMGYLCGGVEIRSRDPRNRAGQIRQRWTATQAGFKQPLLEVVNWIGSQGELISMTTRIVTSLEPVGYIDAALFELPPGYQIIDARRP